MLTLYQWGVWWLTSSSFFNSLGCTDMKDVVRERSAHSIRAFFRVLRGFAGGAAFMETGYHTTASEIHFDRCWITSSAFEGARRFGADTLELPV
jgi:hypothetical protein